MSELSDKISQAIYKYVYPETIIRLPFATYMENSIGHTIHYMSSKFKQHTGITINKYKNNLQIQRVKKLLREELSTVRIAQKMGYSSAAHISSQFKRRTGMTPAQYKNTIDHDLNQIQPINQ